MPMFDPITITLLVIAWIGHAALWTAILNNLYGRRLTKKFLKPWRLFTGLLLVAFPPVYLLYRSEYPALVVYEYLCWVMFAVFVLITLQRHLRARPRALIREQTTTHRLWLNHGHALIGDGYWNWLPRIPANGTLNLDVTTMTLAVPGLPRSWDGLSVLLLSDFHFHGTPSQLWFESVMDKIAQLGTPDVVILAGDYLDTVEHRAWMAPILGRLRWNQLGIAILGNHDIFHEPDKTRAELERLGFVVVSNSWKSASIRGEAVTLIGHEGPWFHPGPDLAGIPPGGFRLGISHSPDQFAWARSQQVGLLLCGHVHGGQIRLPVIGSIFVPSVCGRRYDMGVFESPETVMVVSRGLSGKEPIRFRCNPQVIRIELTCSDQ